MTIQQYDKLSATTKRLIGQGLFFEAISMLRDSISEDTALRSYASQLTRIEETYGFIVKFALNGVSDPSRREMLRNIKNDLLSLLDSIRRTLSTPSTSSLYYSIVRTREHQRRNSDIPTLLDNYRHLASDYSMALFADPDGKSDQARKIKKEMEKAESELFTEIWTTFPLSVADENALRAIMSDTVVGEVLKTVCSSALFLAAYTFFDIRALALMLDAYEAAERPVALRALVMFLILVTLPESTQRLEPLRHRLAALAENPEWRTDVEMVFNQFLNTRDTDRIVQKMNNEIIPQVKNFSGDLKEMFGNIDPNDPEALINSDEMAEFMENSDFSKKMREMSEIQENGGDILMATFSHLKGFSFFRDIAAWFTPFHSTRSEVVEAAGGDSNLAELLSVAPALCDNDRYSLILSLKHLPANQRDILSAQLDAQGRQMAEIQAASNLTGSAADRETISNFTRSLFRFFKLFERHNEFSNPFATSLNLLGVDMIADALPATQLLDRAARFYYSHGYYTDALPLLRQQEADIAPDRAAMLYFCIADCLYHTGAPDEALTYFERSEIFDASNRDTVMRLAMLYRRAGNHKKASAYLRRSIEAAPKKQHRRLQHMLAVELVEGRNYQEAASLLYELDFAQPISDPMRRRLAYCQFMLGQFDKVEQTLMRIEVMGASDFVMRAAMDILAGHFENASSMLSLASTAGGMLPEAADNALSIYNDTFKESSVDPELITIVRDEARRRTILSTNR